MWCKSNTFAAFTIVAGLAIHSAPGAPQVGQPFPDISAFDLEGEIPNLGAAKVVIIDFWASWCPPCKAAFPVYDELQNEYGPKGLVIVAVSVDQNEIAMQSFLKRAQPQFAVVRDSKQKLVREVNVPVMPTSYVLDANGVLRFIHEGFYGDKSRDRYVEEIDELLAEVP